jgi:very-short-patch-repair endonuclease
MNNYNHYNKILKPYARKHRNNSTQAEIRLWSKLLRNKQMLGFPFLRQRPIDNYIADFFCKELKLIIETDGITHHSPEAKERDKVREKRLAELGYHLIRFDDVEVMRDIENIRLKIEEKIKQLINK